MVLPFNIVDLQPIFALAALVGALYVAFDQLRTSGGGRQRFVQTIAQTWLLVVLGLVGVEYLFFGNNAILLMARMLDLPAQPVQLGYLASVGLASLVWARE